jgi:hypothetical protein
MYNGWMAPFCGDKTSAEAAVETAGTPMTPGATDTSEAVSVPASGTEKAGDDEGIAGICPTALCEDTGADDEAGAETPAGEAVTAGEGIADAAGLAGRAETVATLLPAAYTTPFAGMAVLSFAFALSIRSLATEMSTLKENPSAYTPSISSSFNWTAPPANAAGRHGVKTLSIRTQKITVAVVNLKKHRFCSSAGNFDKRSFFMGLPDYFEAKGTIPFNNLPVPDN